MTLEEKADKLAEDYVMREDTITKNDRVPFDNGYGFQTVDFEKENEQLKAQIEKMKCCGNCCHCGTNYDCDYCSDHFDEMPDWQLKE